MAISYGPVRFSVFPQSASDVTVTTVGGSAVVLASPIVVSNGYISFSVTEQGQYRINIVESDGYGASYVVYIRSSSSLINNGTIYDHVDDYVDAITPAIVDQSILNAAFVKTINGNAPDVSGNISIVTSGGGVTDHGYLSGLTDDDHSQYLNTIRGDIRYNTKAEVTAAADAVKDRATHIGTQTASTISDFTEAVEDAVAALLGAGTNVTVTYDDVAGTLIIASTGGGATDAETVRDVIGTALVGVGLISISVNDAGDTISISTTATTNSTDAALRDRTTHTGSQAQGTITGLTSDLAAKAPIASPTFTGTVSGITKTMVGLANVDDTSDVNKPVSTATQTALNAKANLASPTFTGTVSGITKTMVGLDQVDNTADSDKPLSSATVAALAVKTNLDFVRPVLRPTSSSAALDRSGAPAGYSGPVEFDTTAYAPYTGTITGMIAGDWLSDRP